MVSHRPGTNAGNLHATSSSSLPFAGSSEALAPNAAPPATGEASRWSDAPASGAATGGGLFAFRKGKGKEAAINEKDEVAAGGAAGGAAATTTPQKKPIYKRRWFIIASIINACIGIALIFILLYPVVAAIAQSIVNKSVLRIEQAEITNPTNTSFGLALTGVVTHTGIFSAKIMFTEPITVSWMQGKNATAIGVMNMTPLTAKKHRAQISQQTVFNITDEAAFTEFSKVMITQQNFTWRLESHKLKVAALKFPVAHGLKFKKTLTLNGFNSFNGNVTLNNFLLPSDAPEGGINFEAATGLVNPSPFKLDLGTTVFNLSFANVFLGSGSSANTVIAPGNNDITLKGVLIPQETSNLPTVSKLFTQYLNGETSPVIATGQSAVLGDGTEVSWLSEGLKALNLNVPFKSAQDISPIKSISIGSMDLAFTPDTEWAPLTNSDSVQASMELPFGFSVSIGQIENAFNITQNNSVVAGLSTPLGASTSDIHVLGSTDTKGTINITIANSSLASVPSDHSNFASFNKLLTNSEVAEFQLAGHAKAIANMSIGAITLDPINFNVTSKLNGLQGLKGYTIIEGIDVMGGEEKGLDLSVNVSIFNPSNLNLDIGDLTLQLLKDGKSLGTTLLPALKLNMGNNSIMASAVFAANDNPTALQTLNDYVAGSDVPISIGGASYSTEVASLLPAFETIDIGATLPGLKSLLLASGSLQVLDTTGHENNMSTVHVNLANPFTADLHITKISSSVKSFGINLGSIESTDAFMSPGKQTSSSPTLPLNMNLDPSSIFTVTRQLAIAAGLSTEQLDGIVDLGGYKYLSVDTSTDATPRGNSSSSKRDNIYTNFNLPDFIDAAFKQLRTDVDLEAGVTIGNYSTTLTYKQTDLPISTDDSLNLLLPILAQPIVQKVVAASVLGIEHVLISDIAEDSFTTAMAGKITNAGPFDAKISFPEGLVVEWGGKPIGQVAMDDIDVVGDVGATFSVSPKFKVLDVDQLTAFSKVMLTEESFDWTITGQNLSVAAMGISVSGIAFGPANVTLKGMNGLKGGVKINTFDLPENDPAGGIHLTVDTSVANPSQIGISLDSLTFNVFANDTQIGITSANSSFTLNYESTTELGLAGRLLHQDSDEGLATIATIFNNFIHGKDSAVSVHGASAEPSVSWLNNAITSLQVDTSLPNQGVLSLIKSIDLDQLQLMFSEDDPFAPMSGSNATESAFTLPFTMPVDIIQLQGDFVVGANDVSIAELKIPMGPVSTDVDARIIHITFANVPFAAYSDKHSQFDDFVAGVTTSKNATLHLSGSANVNANTGVGTIPLNDIAFSVDTSIAGLQGLNAKPTTVGSLDVVHGYTDYLLIATTASLYNPSNLTIGTGDVQFGLVFEEQTIGSALMDDLVIIPGSSNYSVAVHFSPQGGAVPAGRTLLENYIQGDDSSTTIAGSTDSTPIESLKEALSDISLSPVVIAGINTTLVTSAKLVFPTDIVQTGIAQADFTMANPFTASLNILTLTATATYRDLTLGMFDHIDLSSDPFHTDGHTSATSQFLPFKFNLDPATIVNLLLDRSQDTGTDLGPLPDLFAIAAKNPNGGSAINTTVDTSAPTCVSGHQFDVNDAILNDLKGLEVNLSIDSDLKIDDYATSLSFNQSNVPAITDETALYLIGAVAPPIVQQLVDQAVLKFTEADISGVTNEGFDLSLTGSLTNIGPLDALITFVEPVVVTWQGKDIATITLPPVCGAADDGVPDYKTSAHLIITDTDEFTAFASFLLLQPEFEWTISTDKLRVTALGTIFDNVSLSKTVSFKAFNNLPGVTISNFELPADTADGIEISTDSTIPSPAQLGIELGTVEFDSFFDDVEVGPLTAQNLTLKALSTVTAHLSGEITKKSGSELDTIGKLFSDFLAGKNQTLQVTGVSITPPGQSSPVGWLSTAFKDLTLSVILPGHIYKIIDSIKLEDFKVEMTSDDEAYAPLASSQTVDATYQNPFGFSLQVIQSGENITLSLGGTGIASLQVPMQDAVGGVSTGNVAPLVLSFSDVPMESLNNGAFQQLFAAVTDTSEADFTLGGTANVVARTNIGNVPISGIPFDVDTSLSGINSFGGQTTLSNVTIVGSGGDGGNEYVKAPLTTTLDNPSNISLETVDISLEVIYEGVKLGQAALSPFNLTPGTHDYAAEFHYMPDNANDTTAQGFLTDYLQSSKTLPLSIQGDSGSSPFGSLVPALEGVKLSTSLTGMDVPPIISHVNVYISLETLITNEVDVDFDVTNPLDTELVLTLAQSDSKVDGVTYAIFTQPFSSFVVPAHSTANSGKFSHTLLVKGALASLAIIPLGYLDVSAASTVRVGGSDGYEIPWLKLQQDHVPTDYNLELTPADIASAVASAASSVVSDVTSVVGDVTSVVGDVTSAIGSGVSSVAGDVTSAVGHVTSAVGHVTSAVGHVTSAVGSGVTSAVGAASSVASAVKSDVTSAASEVRSEVSSVASAGAGVASSLVGDVTAAAGGLTSLIPRATPA